MEIGKIIKTAANNAAKQLDQIGHKALVNSTNGLDHLITITPPNASGCVFQYEVAVMINDTAKEFSAKATYMQSVNGSIESEVICPTLRNERLAIDQIESDCILKYGVFLGDLEAIIGESIV